ncbi:hypothetical protein L5515_015953 [Caenorhabditis briggsae]|uniref:SAND domain-containing protein n=2 Tax=Caenorhabditis briggsae TaxID=6238 RepID=A0AAE9J9F4_CAEBR|nr:hypothetical protein L5515_015953 [Caenorhabditis briggsae]
MKRSFSDGVEEAAKLLEPAVKLLKENLENDDEVQEGQEELVNLGSESIPSPASSGTTPETAEPIQMPKYMAIKCGNLIGRLHTELFICPGIREQCIEIAGCSQLLTPVEFTIRAEKSKQKDWKGSIKHNGRMLRTMMEDKQLDFYNHEEHCSFKCHSRNYITKNGGTQSKDVVRVKQAPQRRHSIAAVPIVPPQTFINQFLQERMINPELLSILQAHCNAENQKRLEEAERQRLQKQHAIKNLLRNDPVTFWKQIMLSKLPAMVFSKISNEFGIIAQNLSYGTEIASNAQKLLQMIQAFNLEDALCREMCGEFILPTSNVVPLLPLLATSPILATPPVPTQKASVPVPSKEIQPIQPILPIQNPQISFFNNNNNHVLTSSEKLEMMLQSMHN